MRDNSQISDECITRPVEQAKGSTGPAAGPKVEIPSSAPQGSTEASGASAG